MLFASLPVFIFWSLIYDILIPRCHPASSCLSRSNFQSPTSWVRPLTNFCSFFILVIQLVACCLLLFVLIDLILDQIPVGFSSRLKSQAFPVIPTNSPEIPLVLGLNQWTLARKTLQGGIRWGGPLVTERACRACRVLGFFFFCLALVAEDSFAVSIVSCVQPDSHQNLAPSVVHNKCLVF
jgi:hypothetical protein